MESPANTPPGSQTELERLAKVQLLGEQADLGRPRVETPDAGKTAAKSGPAEIPRKIATPGGGQAAAIPTAIRRGKAAAGTATTSGGPTAAFTAATAGGSPEAIETCPGKTGKSEGKIR